MMQPNTNYTKLKDSYLFAGIARQTQTYLDAHPGKTLLRMGIGDVSQPLCPSVIDALHKAVDEQAGAASFHGYQPECGAPFLREAIAGHYAKRGVSLSPDEVFVSSGASDELGDILDLFSPKTAAMVLEPAYPAYLDASVIAGREIVHVPAGVENGFLPMPPEGKKAGLIYLCSPNNPTGAVFSKAQLQTWVDYANETGAVILFDAAYEAFIEDDALPHSIFELDGARTCAIEICSLSKTAGFTGTRLGYTVLPKTLERAGQNLNAMWTRNRTTKVLTAALERCGIWYTGGKNAPYVWLQCPGGMDSWAFFAYLLKEIQVVGTPGEGFGKSGEGFFRFSTFASSADTAEAAKRLVQLLGAGA